MNNRQFEDRLHRHAAVMKEKTMAPSCMETEVFEMSNNKRVHRIGRRLAVIAVAAVFLIGGTALAAGLTGGWFSAAEEVYEDMPAQSEVAEKLGCEPVLPERFENGFAFTRGSINNTDVISPEGSYEGSFKSANFAYARDGEEVYLDQTCAEEVSVQGEVIGNCGDVELYYYSYMNKIVPENYELSESEQEARDKGEIIFTFGSDSVQTMEVKSLSWRKDGINFSLLQLGGSLDADALCDMAAELIG